VHISLTSLQAVSFSIIILMVMLTGLSHIVRGLPGLGPPVSRAIHPKNLLGAPVEMFFRGCLRLVRWLRSGGINRRPPRSH